MSTTKRALTLQSVKSIMSKRTTVPEIAVGKRVVFSVQGNGTLMDVKDKAGNVVQSVVEPGTVLQKRIFNLQAVSGIAMANERNKGFLRDGLLAEKNGDTAKADELFTEFLNATQMSFGLLLPSNLEGSIAPGVEIAAKVIKVTTDNGSLLTIDPATISIIEPERYESTTFNLDDFMAVKTDGVKTTV